MTNRKRTETWAWVLGILAAIIVVGFIGSIWQDNRVIDQAVTRNIIQPSPLADAPIATAPVTPEMSLFPSEAGTTPSETGIVPTENESEMGTVAVTPETVPAVPTEERVDFEIGESTNLATNPNQYIGATVAVEGVLSEAVSDGVFTVTGGGEEMLVISKIQQQGDIEKGAQVRIVGTAKRMSMTELTALETEVGYDLKDDLAKRFENQIVVVAETVQAQAH